MANVAFANSLVELIQRAGLSQAEIARQLGCGRTTVGRWMRGERVMSPVALEQFCTTFGISDADRRTLYQLAGYVLPQAPPVNVSTVTHSLSLAGDIVHGDKIEGDKVEGDKIIYIGMQERPQPTAIQRRQRLEEVHRDSRARCIRRWQAVGLSRNEAIAFADHPIVSTTTIHTYVTDEHPLRILIGEIGAGKSLSAERFFQLAVEHALQTEQAPVPIYLSAQDVTHGLRSAVFNAAESIGVPAIHGVTIIIDGADEVGGVAARAILDEARELVNAWDHTTILITSRPMPNFGHSTEHIVVEPLSEQQAQALIQRVAGPAFNPVMSFSWPQQLKEAIQRPLFALLFANNLHTGKTQVASIGGLLSELIEQALDNADINHLIANRLLQRLAVFCIDRGGDPLITEIAAHHEVQHLLATRLVHREGNRLRFALTIFAEWFAALSLSEGYPTAEQIITDPQRLEQWHYPLAMLVSSFSFEQVSRLLCPLAELYPPIAARVIHDGLPQWGHGDGPILPDAQECGRRIRTAMQSLVQGIGPLASLIAPIRADRTLLPLGIRAQGKNLTTSWYGGSEQLPDVVELPPASVIFGQLDSGWNTVRSSYGLENSAWLWNWTLHELAKEVIPIIRQKTLPIDNGPIADEKLWRIGSALSQWKRKFIEPIPLTLFEEWLSNLSPDTVEASVSGHSIDLAWLRRRVTHLRENGSTEIRAPWPRHDRALHQGGIWSLYSEEQQLARTRAVFQAALESYQELITTWFSQLAPAMSLAVTLPAKLVGLFKPATAPGHNNDPSMIWWFEPFPRGSKSFVEIQFGVRRIDDPYWDEERAKRRTLLRTMRPEAVSWVGIPLHQGASGVFRDTAIADLVYDWLEWDLRGAFWLR